MITKKNETATPKNTKAGGQAGRLCISMNGDRTLFPQVDYYHICVRSIKVHLLLVDMSNISFLLFFSIVWRGFDFANIRQSKKNLLSIYPSNL
mmetsp:Transcript_39779/g.96000  ORF Transcript_39779/g.96000 Transcript_39779/m.96000 type:complete len:93 (+) Transcript_39779:640-918(+)